MWMLLSGWVGGLVGGMPGMHLHPGANQRCAVGFCELAGGSWLVACPCHRRGCQRCPALAPCPPAVCALTMLAEAGWGGESPLAHWGLIPAGGSTLASAPVWLKLGAGVFALGALGVLSGFGSWEDSDTY